MNRDPHVKCSIMFGSGKFQNGILVQPHEQHAIDPSDNAQLEAFRNKIWFVVRLCSACGVWCGS